MSILGTRAGTLPSGGEIVDRRDVDRWENEGGRSFGTTLGSSRDWQS